MFEDTLCIPQSVYVERQDQRTDMYFSREAVDFLTDPLRRSRTLADGSPMPFRVYYYLHWAEVDSLVAVTPMVYSETFVQHEHRDDMFVVKYVTFSGAALTEHHVMYWQPQNHSEEFDDPRQHYKSAITGSIKSDIDSDDKFVVVDTSQPRGFNLPE